MSRNIGPQEESKPKVPTYIVTFSDMITLLLTFFVLLLSMSSEQVENAKFEKGRDALINAMNNVGIKGISTSDKPTPEQGEERTVYPSDKDEMVTEQEALDVTEEVIRRIFKELEKQMDKITPAQIVGGAPNFRPISIEFDKGSWELSQPSVKYLKNFSFNLQKNIGIRNQTLYVVGQAGEEENLKKQCIVSANRAQTVADFLRKSLPEDLKWKIYSWGTGPGGEWKNDGPVEESQIVIAVLNN